jgi:translocation and assembly module TamB
MGSASGLQDAVVNDEVSHRVLMFAAPVLDRATRVQGRISLTLNDAFFPISARPEAQARVDGDMLFDSVEFMPGPLAEQLLSVFRLEQRPLLVLRDPISIRILGRRIYQEGLVIPVAKVAVIGLDGWVDFDQNLDLVARFAMIPPRRNIPVLSQVLENTQIQVPITGTLKNPKLNAEAIKDRFKDMGTNLLETMMEVGANGLNRVLGGGAGGNAGARRDVFPPFTRPDDDRKPPPPRPGSGQAKESKAKDGDAGAPRPSPEKKADGQDADKPPSRPGQLTPEERQLLREEKRQRRLDKRAERRLRRGLPPQ